jgi:ribosomal protein S18 acetylase RimI-like enzyme
MLHIRAMTIQDTPTFRHTRLRALQDTPLAFGSTYAKEAANTDAEWAERARKWTTQGEAVVFLAFDSEDAGSCCGIVGCFNDREKAGRAHIVSMWVAPEVRRQGLGRRLIEAVEGWARQQQFSELLLHATETNQPAIELYLRCGFVLTVESVPYPNAPNLCEFIMVKQIG